MMVNVNNYENNMENSPHIFFGFHYFTKGAILFVYSVYVSNKTVKMFIIYAAKFLRVV